MNRHWLIFLIFAYPLLTFPLAALGHAFDLELLAIPFRLVFDPVAFILSRSLSTLPLFWVIVALRRPLFFGYALLFIASALYLSSHFRAAYPQRANAMVMISIVLCVLQPLAFSAAIAHVDTNNQQYHEDIEAQIRREHPYAAVDIANQRVELTNVPGWSVYRYTIRLAGLTDPRYHYTLFSQLYNSDDAGSIIGPDRYTNVPGYEIDKKYYTSLEFSYSERQRCWTYYALEGGDSVFYKIGRRTGPVGDKCIPSALIRGDGAYEIDVQVPFETENGSQVQVFLVSLSAWRYAHNEERKGSLYHQYFTIDGTPVTPSWVRR